MPGADYSPRPEGKCRSRGLYRRPICGAARRDVQAGGMEMTKRKLATTTLFTGIAVTLAACGAGSSSHVVQRVTPPSSVATTPTTATAATAPVPGSVSATPTTTSAALNSQTLDQVAADLGALDNSLSTANSDLNNPQGDS